MKLDQVNLLACAEDDPLPGFKIPRYSPQTQSYIQRINTQYAPESQFTESVLQLMTAGAERYTIAIRRLDSNTTVRSRTHMRGL